MSFFTQEFSNQTVLIFLMGATFRVYLEIIGFDFGKLPLTKSLSQASKNNFPLQFHQFGLYVSVGYIILFAPQFLF